MQAPFKEAHTLEQMNLFCILDLRDFFKAFLELLKTLNWTFVAS